MSLVPGTVSLPEGSQEFRGNTVTSHYRPLGFCPRTNQLSRLGQTMSTLSHNFYIYNFA